MIRAIVIETNEFLDAFPKYSVKRVLTTTEQEAIFYAG